IAKTDRGQQMQPLLEPRRPRKKSTCLVDRHVQHLRDRLASMANREDLRLKPLAFAALAGGIHVFKKVHFQFFNASPLTTLTSAAFGVERKIARRESLPQGVPLCGKQLSDLVKGFEVCDRIGPGCSSDGLLINQADTFHVFDPLDG